jgi:hypothetical protein
MVWVIIGCTLLIIVCLGGGKRLAKIISGALLVGGLAIFAVVVPEGSGPTISQLMGPVLVIVGFFVVMAIGVRLKARNPDSWWWPLGSA